jgi:hypothetical protein
MRRIRFRHALDAEVIESDVIIASRKEWDASDAADSERWSVDEAKGIIVALKITLPTEMSRAVRPRFAFLDN